MKQIAIGFILMSLIGCGESKTVRDQCKHADLFLQCMSIIPKGPKSTVYNDWDDVIEQCRYFADSASRRKKSVVAEECKAN